MGGRVYYAFPKKITLPERDGKPEKTFYTLEKPRGASQEVLVRVMTGKGYTRRGNGRWITVSGNPNSLVAGWGADGAAGGIGTWSDGLVKMAPGDVLKVQPSGGGDSYALWLDQKNEPRVASFAEWQAGQNAKATSAQKTPVETTFSTMPVFSFGTTTGEWALTEGVETTSVPGGRGLKLGPRDNSWRMQSHELIAVADEFPPVVTRAAVAQVGKNFAFVTSPKVEEGKFLVRIDTAGLRKRGRTGATNHRGEPVLLTQGSMEHGTKNVIAHQDQLWVMDEGDVLRIGQTWYEDVYSSDWAIVVENGQIKLENFFGWLLVDARKNPAPYIGQGWVPVEHVPADWIGRVVEKYTATRENEGYGTWLVESVKPLVLNGGWDDNPPTNFRVRLTESTAWLKLRPDLSAEAPLNILSEEEIYVFGSPPLSDGTRVRANISTEIKTGQGRWGTQTTTTYIVTVADVPAEKVKVTQFEKSRERGENREDLGKEFRTWSAKILSDGYSSTLWMGNPSGVDSNPVEGELNGEFIVEFRELRVGYRIHILTDEILEAEKAAILAEVKANLPLRQWAKRIPGQREGETALFGMPIGEDGWTPCVPEKATRWVMYMADHRWQNAFPDAYVLVPMKGFRSKSTGQTFQELVRDFNR